MNRMVVDRPSPAVRMVAGVLLLAVAALHAGAAAGQSVRLDPNAASETGSLAFPRTVVPVVLWAPPAPRPEILANLQYYDSLPLLSPPAPRPALVSMREMTRLVPTLEPQIGRSRYLKEPASTRTIIAEADVSGITGAVLFDLSNGLLLDAHARHISLPPASTIKVATGAWALEVLGPRYRFETRVLATGPVVDGRIQGDLVLQGGGDPALDNPALAAMVDALARSGIRGVDGGFLVDDTSLPRGSLIDAKQRDGTPSSPGFGALNLNFNRVRLESDFLDDGSIELRVIADADEISVPVPHISARVVEPRRHGRNGLLRHEVTEGGEAWRIDLRSVRDQPVRWLPVRDPGLYAASVFRTLAEARGLALPAPERARAGVTGTQLAVHRGRPLAEVVAGMLDYSNNLTAEILGLMAAGASSDAPARTLPEGAKRMAAWVGTSFASYNRLVDHSGLGDGARVTPSAFQSILVRSVAPRGTSEADIRGVLPVYSLAPSDSADLVAPAIIQAKTGTLYYVRGLVGYIRLGTASTREFGFAIFSTDLQERRDLEVGQFDSGPPREVEDAREWRKRAVALETEILRNWIRALS